jgi:hypothetical protein
VDSSSPSTPAPAAPRSGSSEPAATF